jgi:L-asparaginase
MTLRVIATGGTFDKHYDEIAGKLCFGTGHLADIIRRARITAPIALEELPFLDSLDMQEADRQRILSSCAQAQEPHIVIVHGTDTMRESAELLGRAALDKTIVLTGAMIPYEIAESDALFNFGFAIGVAQTLAPNVYIAMNGRVFAWDGVEKNRAAGVFQSR